MNIVNLANQEQRSLIDVACRWVLLSSMRTNALTVAAVLAVSLWLYSSSVFIWRYLKAQHTTIPRMVWYVACGLSTMPFVLPAFVVAALQQAFCRTSAQDRFIHASFHGNMEIVRSYLEQRADVNAVDGNGRTALAVASRNGHLDVVRVLLEHGANVNAVDEDGWTALAVACIDGHLDVVRVLLEHGANVNAVDGNGWTALRVASENGHLDVVRVLLEHGANVDTVDGDDNEILRQVDGYIREGQFVELIIRCTYDLHRDENDLRARRLRALAYARVNLWKKAEADFRVLQDDHALLNVLDLHRRHEECRAEFCETSPRYYDILGLNIQRTTEAQISSQRRKLALRLHVDRLVNETEAVKKELGELLIEVNGACDVLSDRETRCRYRACALRT